MDDLRGSFSLFRRHEFGLLLAILIALVAITVLDQQHNYWFKPQESAAEILRQSSRLGIFALGAAIVIIAGGIDLSTGSVIAFSGTVCACVMLILAPEQMRSAQPIPTWILCVSVLSSLLVGFLIGSLHAWMITVIRLPPFVATLSTLVGLRSLGRILVENVTAAIQGSKTTQINIFDQSFRTLGKNVSISVALFAILATLVWILLSKTVTGRHLYAVGGNEEAARLSGIRTERVKWLAYVISSMLAAVAGVLYICDQSVADPQMLGQGYELNAIAASVVGGCSLQGGAGTIPGTVLGAFFLRLIVDGVAKVIKSNANIYEGLIVGSVVIFAVALTQAGQSRGRSRPFFQGTLGIVVAVTLIGAGGLMTGLLAPPKAAISKLTAALIGGLVTAGAVGVTALIQSRRK